MKFNILVILNKMASTAIMIGGAVVIAASFIVEVFAKYLSGESDFDKEKKRHDLGEENIRRSKRNMRKIGQSFSNGLQRMPD